MIILMTVGLILVCIMLVLVFNYIVKSEVDRVFDDNGR